MSNDLPDLGSNLKINTEQAARDVRAFMRVTDNVVDKIDQLMQTALRAEGALRSLGQEMSKIESGKKINFTADVSDLEGVKATAENAAKEASPPKIVYEADTSEIEGAAAEVESVPDSIPVSFDAKTNDAFKETVQTLHELRNMEILTFTVNMVTSGAGAGISFLTDPIVETENAVALFEAKTGKNIESLGDQIETVYTGAWGESREEVARVMAQISNDMKIPEAGLASMTTQILDVANVLDEDYAAVIERTSQMVDAGLVGSFEEAFDVLVVGQQNGLNRAGDLLDTFGEYSSTFVDMGFSAEDALSVMNAGLEAGIDNTDRIADAIREGGVRSTTDLEAKSEFLKQLGMLDEAEAFAAGEMSGKEYLDGLFGALADLRAEGDSTLADLIQDELIGTISEDFGADAVAALGNVQEEIKLVGDEAETAGTRINDTIGTSIESLQRTLQSEASAAFNEQFQFGPFIENLNGAIQGLFEDIDAGAGFAASLGVAMGEALEGTVIGEFLDSFISLFEEFIIFITEGIADILDHFDDGAAASLRSVKNSVVEMKLGEELAESIAEADYTQALDAIGDAALVDKLPIDDLNRVVGLAFNNAFESGDAVQIAETIPGLAALAAGSAGAGIDLNLDDEFGRAAQAGLVTFNRALAEGDLSGALILGDKLVDFGFMDAAQLSELKSTVSDQFGSIISDGLQPEDLEGLPDLFGAVVATMTPEDRAAAEGRLGAELAFMIDNAIANTDFESAESGIDLMKTILGEDTGVFDQALDDAKFDFMLASQDIRTEAETNRASVDAAIGAMGDIVSTTTPDMESDLDNAAGGFTKLGEKAKTGTGEAGKAMTGFVAGTQINTDLILTSIDLIKEAFAGLNLPLITGQLALAGGAAGTVVNNSTNVTVNQTNNNNGAAAGSQTSGQGVANAIIQQG